MTHTMENPGDMVFANNLLKALLEANNWSGFVPPNTVRDLPPEIVSKLCNELKKFSRYSRMIRELAYAENLFQNPSPVDGNADKSLLDEVK